MKKTKKNDDSFYESLDDCRQQGGYIPEKIEFIKRNIGKFPQNILDVGCNDGFIGEQLISLGHTVIGIDVSSKALIRAKKRGIKTYRLDIEKESFPLKGKSVDVVILGDVIEHVFDTDHLLEKCFNVLTNKGRIIISTPNIASLGRRIMLLSGFSPYVEFSIKIPTNNLPSVGHIRYYTFSTLIMQLTLHNFVVKVTEGDIINIGPFPSRLLAKIFPMLSRQIFIVAEKK